jgi:hypothetical protein
MNIQFELNKLYYKYIDPSAINHYRLLLLTEEYIQLARNYFYKYPKAEGWRNLNKELFDSNKQAEIEYTEICKKRAVIKNDFFKNLKIICNNNKDCIICSPSFQEFYVDRNYHYDQMPEHVIEDIKSDIKNMGIS